MLYVALAVTLLQQPARSPEGMEVLARSVRTIEGAVAAGELAPVDSAVTEARTTLAAVRRGAHRDVSDEPFRNLVDALDRQLDEVAWLAERGSVEGVRQTLDAARSTCVRCHLRFRDGGGERGMFFPARERTVFGRVELRDREGNEVPDATSVLVFLERTDGPSEQRWHRRAPSLSQVGRRFVPRLLPVVAGASVSFPNDDAIFHNVFSLSRSHPFDLGIYEPGDTREVTFDEPGLIKLYCNIHPEMSANILVLDNPWFSIVDDGGLFVTTGVPAGRYWLRAWNERGVDLRQELDLTTVPHAEVDLRLQETQTIRQHTNKFGKRYPRTKY